MRTHSTVVSLFAFGLFGFAALSARHAFAESQCASDSDCVKGWQCQVTGASGCGYACAPGQDCAPPPVCETQEYKSCVPGPCTADSDCADGMICYTQQVGCDDVPPCAAGANCETPACTPTTQSQCLPKYDVPCTADADCGAGFTCLPDSSGCACAGSGSAPSSGSNGATPAMDGGSPAPSEPPPTTCNCPAVTTSSCHAVPKVCDSATDCPATWTCEVVGGGGCTGTPTPASDGGAAPPNSGGAADAGAAPHDGGNGAVDGGAAPPDPGGNPEPCSPPPTIKQCMPPYYTLGGGSYVNHGGDPERGAGAPTGGDLGVDGGNSNGATPPKASTGDSSSLSPSGGCSVSHGASSSAGGLGLLLLGLFGLGRRGRAQKSAATVK